MSDGLDALARELGIAESYVDMAGQTRLLSAESRSALVRAMGVDPTSASAVDAALVDLTAPRALPGWHVCEPGRPDLRPEGPWRLTREDGTSEEGRGPLPSLPLGIHRLESDGAVCWLLLAPRTLPLPARGWGVTLPLYGIGGPDGRLGSYADLADAAEALGLAGAGFVGINPVHAEFPGDPAAISPYSPSHRRWRSVQHLSFGPEAAPVASDTIDYAGARRNRIAAAQAAFELGRDDPAFERFRHEGGESLGQFALYQALAEVHGPYWDAWPPELQSPSSQAVQDFAAGAEERIRFHEWLQFMADRQLQDAAHRARRAGLAHGLYLDLAVGTHPHGAETWAERESFAFGVSLGAPPDAFSPEGQSWALAPFTPHALVRSGFAPLAETLRRQLSVARMLRIDHILGFDRAFWVPENGAPGGYVSMPRDAMLAVVRIEAARVGAVIVGEDLGNIPPGLQTALEASGILGCRVAIFDPGRNAADYTKAALTSFATHDLPTWVGWRAGHDIEIRKTVGLMAPDAAEAAMKERRRDIGRFDRVRRSRAKSVGSMHAFLAATTSCLVAVQIEDVLGLKEQANLPGTVDEYPNWSRPLPVAASDLGALPELKKAALAMKKAGRGGDTSPNY